MVPKHAITPQNQVKTEKLAKFTTRARQAMVFIIFDEFIGVTIYSKKYSYERYSFLFTGTLLHEETKSEPAGPLNGFDASEFESFFDEMRRMMGSIFSNPFRTIF